MQRCDRFLHRSRLHCTPIAQHLMMTDPVVIPDTRVFDPNAAQLYTDEELADSRRYRDDYRYENTWRYQLRFNDYSGQYELSDGSPVTYFK
jgi:hypothetical protein